MLECGNFFSSDEGAGRNFMKFPVLAACIDFAVEIRKYLDPRTRIIAKRARHMKRCKVLVVGVDVPERSNALHNVTSNINSTRHQVDISTIKMQPIGKFDNISSAIAIAPNSLDYYDWLLIVDDDVSLPSHFLDNFLACLDLAGLTLSQPAHKFRSYASYEVTRRKFGSFVRRTDFVEIGPITCIHNSLFKDIVPFPSLRWGWGIDVLWSDLALKNNWKIGVVDFTAIRHLRPVGASYDWREAIAHASDFLKKNGVNVSRKATLRDRGELIR